MTRLAYLVGILLLIGFVLALRAPLAGLHPTSSVPAPADELWTLNPG